MADASRCRRRLGTARLIVLDGFNRDERSLLENYEHAELLEAVDAVHAFDLDRTSGQIE